MLVWTVKSESMCLKFLITVRIFQYCPEVPDWSRCSRIAGLPNENPVTDGDPENIQRKERDVEIGTVVVSGQTIPATNHP